MFTIFVHVARVEKYDYEIKLIIVSHSRHREVSHDVMNHAPITFKNTSTDMQVYPCGCVEVS